MKIQGSISAPIIYLRERLKHVLLHLRAFPHNTRLFSARAISGFVGKALLWLVLLFVIVANIYMAYGNNSNVLKFIRTYVLHQAPVKADLKNVLGTEDTKQKNKKDTTDIQQSYDYWKIIIRDHPDYRDGYIQAAMRAYELGLFSEVRGYIEKAKSIDPNFAGIPSIEDRLPRE